MARTVKIRLSLKVELTLKHGPPYTILNCNESEEFMARPLILASFVLAVIGAIFGLAHIAEQFVPVLFAAAIILTDIGILTSN